MNYIKPVAKILGVKPGEVFKLTGYNGLFRITERGLEKKAAKITWISAQPEILHEIITGITEIVKLEGI